MLKKHKFFITFTAILSLAFLLAFASFAEPDAPEADDMPVLDENEVEEESAVEKGNPVKMGIVKGTGSSGIYIRSLPSKNGKVLYGVAEDTELVIISNEGNWYKVAYYGHVGYASADYIVPYSASDCEFGAGTVVGSFVNIRTEPNTESPQAGVLPEGTTVSIIGVEGGWYYICLLYTSRCV